MHIGDVWSFDARMDLLILSVWHFAILKFICQSLAHSESSLMSFCKMSSSSGLVICLYNRESSAKRRSFELIFLCKSLIYTRKNNGPRTVPCGTPDVTAASLDWHPSTTTLCVRWVSQLLIHNSRDLFIPLCFNLKMSLVNETLSKAFVKSKMTLWGH